GIPSRQAAGSTPVSLCGATLLRRSVPGDIGLQGLIEQFALGAIQSDQRIAEPGDPAPPPAAVGAEGLVELAAQIGPDVETEIRVQIVEGRVGDLAGDDHPLVLRRDDITGGDQVAEHPREDRRSAGNIPLELVAGQPATPLTRPPYPL